MTVRPSIDPLVTVFVPASYGSDLLGVTPCGVDSSFSGADVPVYRLPSGYSYDRGKHNFYRILSLSQIINDGLSHFFVTGHHGVVRVKKNGQPVYIPHTNRVDIRIPVKYGLYEFSDVFFRSSTHYPFGSLIPLALVSPEDVGIRSRYDAVSGVLS